MKKIIYLFLFSFILIYSTYSKNLTFPVLLLQDNYNIKNISQTNNLKYKLTFIYDISKIKKELKDDSFVIILTPPQSNSYQKTAINSIQNFSIKEIKKNSTGSTVIISEKIPSTIQINYLKIIYDITTYPSNDRKSFSELNEQIKIFKSSIYQDGLPTDIIYDEKIINSYPISDELYLNNSFQFADFILKKNITAKVCFVYYAPSKVGYFTNDFIIQLFINEKYLTTLDKYLNAFSYNGFYILNNYKKNNIEILSNDKIINIQPEVNLSIDRADSKSIYSNLKKESLDEKNISEPQKKVLDKVFEFLGKPPYSSVIVNNKKFVLDCMGFISAIFYSIDFDIQKEISSYKGRNGVSKFFNYLTDKNMLHKNKIPVPGDVIIWDNTWDFNNDGIFGNDFLTHAGLVVKVEPDGTIHYAHVHLKNGVVVEKLNLFNPNQRFDETGKEINSAMHAQSGLNFKKHLPYLSGELWKTNAIFLKKQSK